MTNYVPLSQQRHQAAGFEKVSNYAHAAQDSLAPVVVTEVAKLIPRMPLAFYKTEQMSGYQLVALQGLLPNQNLFINDDNKILAGYLHTLLTLRAQAVQAQQQAEEIDLDTLFDQKEDDRFRF